MQAVRWVGGQPPLSALYGLPRAFLGRRRRAMGARMVVLIGPKTGRHKMT